MITNKRILVAASALLLLIISSCKLVCDPGYEGKHCVVEIREKYLGGFWGTRSCTSANGTDSVTITASTDVTKVFFRNLNGNGANTIGAVQQDGTITITSQNLAGKTIAGNASVQAGKIVVSYTISDTAGANTCSWTQN